MGKSLAGRYDESYKSRNQGGSRKGVLDWSKHEGDVKFYKLKEGQNKIDIVPYVIKSKDHPLVKKGSLKVGDLDYTLDVWVHKGIGPVETDAVCLKKNFGKPCPICDQSDEFNRAGKKEESDAYKAKRRVFYNVRDAMKPDEGIMVLEQSHFKFEKELIEEARNGADGEGITDFADPEEGKTVKFRGSAGSFKGHTSIEPKNFQFVDRAEAVGKALMKTAISFDELIVMYTADQLLAIMNGADDDEDEDEEEEAPPPKASKAKKPKDDEADDEPPARTRAKKEEVEDEEEAPASDKPTCPAGGKYGKDNDELPECEDCKLWKDCARASR